MSTDFDCAETDPKDERYTMIVDFSGAYADAAIADRAEDLLSDKGWDVCIRESRTGEAEGIYLHGRQGLQILGYSVPEPDALGRAIDEAVEAARG